MISNDKEKSPLKICILGGGPAGYVAAIRSAQLGAIVTLIEKSEIGGTCLNLGCIPTKTLLKTAELLELIKRSDELTASISPSSINMNIMNIHKSEVIKNLKTGLEHLLNSNKINIIKGEGTIETPYKVKVKTNDQELTINCDKLIIAYGSTTFLPNISGINLPGVITSNEAINLTAIPASIIILGAGAIGLEFATLFNALGSKVTVVELQNKILPAEDQDITTELMQIMQKQGVNFKLGSEVKLIKNDNNNLTVVISNNGTDYELTSEKVLAAIGRIPNITSDIKSLNLKMNGRAIAVNEYFETSIPDVYAAGDVIGGKLIAHLAFAEGKAAAENANGGKSTINPNTVPSCVYTHPEIASVGINEANAIANNIKIKTGRFDFNNNPRFLCQGCKDGFIKVIIDEKSNIILGAQVLGPNASEMISEFTLAITLKAKAEDIADMIHPHPSLSEAVMEACRNSLEEKSFIFNAPSKENFLFNDKDCWVEINNNIARLGATSTVSNSLPAIEYCTLPAIGKEFKQSETFGSIEAKKTIFELVAPVSGKVIRVNDNVIKNPKLINKSPYEDGWMLDVELTNFTADKKNLLNLTEYISKLKQK